MHLQRLSLIYSIAVLIWTKIWAEKCYKRCQSELVNSLSIELHDKDIVLRCNEKTSNYLTGNDITSFDVKYLNFEDDNSLLNMAQMIKQCHKTREKIIKFDFSSEELIDVLIKKSVLGQDSTIRYFKLERKLNYNKNITLLPRNFLLYGSHLNTIIIKNMGITELKDYFLGLSHIEALDLTSNNIETVDDKVLKDLTSLKFLILKENEISFLSPYTFKGLANMMYLDLSHNKISHLNGKIFSETVNLTILNLGRNRLKEIDDNVFKACRKLEYIDLSGNQRLSFKWTILSNVTSLRSLNLSDCNLRHLPTKLTLSKNLNVLDVSRNSIDNLEKEVFQSLTELRILDLSNNDLHTLPLTLLQPPRNLQQIYLSFNNLTEFDSEAEEFIPEETNVKIYLLQNRIRNINIPHLENLKKAGRTKSWKILLYLSQNKLKCDCLKYRIKSHPDRETVVELTSKEYICYEQVAHYNFRQANIENCPNVCDCYYNRMENAIHVNCSYRNLTEYPQIRDLATDCHQHNQTFVDLSGNFLNLNGQQDLENYVNVTSLDLSNNQIEEIKWLPANLMRLKLEKNRLEFLTQETLKYLENNKRLQKVSLLGNPWTCNCKAKAMKNFLRRYNNTRINDSEMLCQESREPLMSTNVCSDNFSLKVSSSLTFILAISSAFVAVYYKYNTNIKVYIYSKNICSCFVAEEEVDRIKTYDIFISFSNKDERFVQAELLPKLESGVNPFKVCIHYRDWMPGEFISSQIVRSVLDSRRTLVVLSNNFMESVWGKMEFRTAHLQAINEGRARVIVILYGELDEGILDDEMKTYLRTNTYVKWGDPWFWNKLLYALPHSKISREKISYVNQEFLP